MAPDSAVLEYEAQASVCQPKREFDVLGTTERRVEAAYFDDMVAKHRRVARVELPRRRLPVAATHRHVLLLRASLVPNGSTATSRWSSGFSIGPITTTSGCRGEGAASRCAPNKPCLGHDVVVDEEHEITRRQLDASVPTRQPGLGCAQLPRTTGTGVSSLFRYRVGPVRRSVGDDDHLEVAVERLRGQPRQRTMEALATIEGGDDDTHPRHVLTTPLLHASHHCPRSCPPLVVRRPDASADDTDFVCQIEEHPPTKHPVHSTLTDRSDRGGG